MKAAIDDWQIALNHCQQIYDSWPALGGAAIAGCGAGIPIGGKIGGALGALGGGIGAVPGGIVGSVAGCVVGGITGFVGAAVIVQESCLKPYRIARDQEYLSCTREYGECVMDAGICPFLDYDGDCFD